MIEKNKIHIIIFVSAIFFCFFMIGCGVIRGLRKDVEDESGTKKIDTTYFDYNDPVNHMLPPPPTNANDSREAPIAGTPVDLSGIRAKTGRVTRQDFVNESMRNENSLWKDDGQGNYFFSRNKLRSPGDLVTIVIDDQLRRDMVQEVKKIIPPEYRDQDIVVPGLTKNAEDKTNEGAARSPASDAATSTLSSEDTIIGEVLERYPNGNVRVRGIKKIPFKRSVRNIEVVAIVKDNDISEQDQVHSSRFFEHRVELYR